MNSFLKPITDFGKIDFEGQKLAENISTSILVVSAIISLVAGKMLDNMKLAMYIYLFGFVLTVLVVVPPYSFYNKNPVKWLKKSDFKSGNTILKEKPQ
ncbi:hypothetical protein BB559_001301 [Furculomyces boomerangus]|uniref:Signal peptidase complex subunit 1 n=2 Tax=Harpellales TaxID=61421 RepID=A0A2T9Z2H3_9FUNG|nr:hypothetical protein BB559_001301 [Furculomyces boomerangus]PWA01791.1 hypothetical protein BB558_002088 [Smittium angustum]